MAASATEERKRRRVAAEPVCESSFWARAQRLDVKAWVLSYLSSSDKLTNARFVCREWNTLSQKARSWTGNRMEITKGAPPQPKLLLRSASTLHAHGIDTLPDVCKTDIADISPVVLSGVRELHISKSDVSFVVDVLKRCSLSHLRVLVLPPLTMAQYAASKSMCDQLRRLIPRLHSFSLPVARDNDFDHTAHQEHAVVDLLVLALEHCSHVGLVDGYGLFRPELGVFFLLDKHLERRPLKSNACVRSMELCRVADMPDKGWMAPLTRIAGLTHLQVHRRGGVMATCYTSLSSLRSLTIRMEQCSTIVPTLAPSLTELHMPMLNINNDGLRKLSHTQLTSLEVNEFHCEWTAVMQNLPSLRRLKCLMSTCLLQEIGVFCPNLEHLVVKLPLRNDATTRTVAMQNIASLPLYQLKTLEICTQYKPNFISMACGMSSSAALCQVDENILSQCPKLERLSLDSGVIPSGKGTYHNAHSMSEIKLSFVITDVDSIVQCAESIADLCTVRWKSDEECHLVLRLAFADGAGSPLVPHAFFEFQPVCATNYSQSIYASKSFGRAKRPDDLHWTTAELPDVLLAVNDMSSLLWPLLCSLQKLSSTLRISTWYSWNDYTSCWSIPPGCSERPSHHHWDFNLGVSDFCLDQVRSTTEVWTSFEHQLHVLHSDMCLVCKAVELSPKGYSGLPKATQPGEVHIHSPALTKYECGHASGYINQHTQQWHEFHDKELTTYLDGVAGLVERRNRVTGRLHALHAAVRAVEDIENHTQRLQTMRTLYVRRYSSTLLRSSQFVCECSV